MPRVLRLLLRRGRATPWLMVAEGGRWLLTHGRHGWAELTPTEQRELQRLMRLSTGRPGRLTPAERQELLRIVRKGIWAAARS